MARIPGFVTGPVRLSYVHLFEPWALNEDDDPKFSAVLLIPKTDKATLKKFAEAKAAALEEGKQRFGTGWGKKGVKYTVRDGDEEADLDSNPEYAGHMYVSVSNSRRPGIVDRNVQPILDSTEIYSGCWARVKLEVFPYKHQQGGDGISFSLGNVQKLRDDERFDGSTTPEQDFDTVEVEEDSDLF